ncbi:MAG: prepilin-type N-terminal cleavage/methylation domain-containing protein [Proteobacteria bacterium]|nr:prepilin-type N-terminal cleavage/methylation domain-containing protein [Pseudomonadota bacterium]
MDKMIRHGTRRLVLRFTRPLLRARGRSEGFTLIEVVVAMGILATGLLAVSAAQLYAMRGGRSGRHTTDAAEVARSQIETFQRMDWADAGLAQTGGWSAVVAPSNAAYGSVQTPGVAVVEQSYLVSWRIVNVGTYLKTIDVRVTWSEPNRPNRSYTVTTMRHNDARS